MVEPRVKVPLRATVAPGLFWVNGKSRVAPLLVMVCVPDVAANVVALLPAV